MTHEDWREILEDCRADLAVALPTAGEVARGARVVADELPPIGEGDAYGSVSLHDDELGSAHLLSWRAGVPTPPHARERGRVIHLLLDGALYETTWRWSGDHLVAVGERRVHAPDVLLAEPGGIRSLVSPEGATVLEIRTQARDALRVYEPAAREVLVVSDGDAAGPPAEDAVRSREPWGRDRPAVPRDPADV